MKRVLLYLVCLICLAGAAGCGWMFYQEWKPRQAAETVYEAFRETAFGGVSAEESTAAGQKETTGASADKGEQKPKNRTGSLDFETLKRWNPDVTAWIWIPGTGIDYPVVQGPDNEYYLNRTADRQQSIIGSIFMEYRNSQDFQDDVTILYGHHIRGGRMFSELSGYKNQSFYEAHPEVMLYTPDKTYRVELFAGHILDGAGTTFPLIFAKQADRQQWIASVRAASLFHSDTYVLPEDRILALCTCTYEYDNARYIVYGVLQEQTERSGE